MQLESYNDDLIKAQEAVKAEQNKLLDAQVSLDFQIWPLVFSRFVHSRLNYCSDVFFCICFVSVLLATFQMHPD